MVKKNIYSVILVTTNCNLFLKMNNVRNKIFTKIIVYLYSNSNLYLLKITK